MLNTEFFQGDSSPTLHVRVYADGVLVTNLAGFTGKFALVKCLGTTPLVEKNMTQIGDGFRVMLSPEESELLTPGTYTGVVEIENPTIQYRKEQHVIMTVNKQGYIT